jgi:DNA-directed RNA polymerase subunit H (RpoH/RPB5)
VCQGRSLVTVPIHDVLDRGTLRSILRTVDISVEEFVELPSNASSASPMDPMTLMVTIADAEKIIDG